MEKSFICIGCPMGCLLEVTARLKEGEPIGSRRLEDYEITVKGNTCRRGEAYGGQELIAPERTVTGLMENDRGEIVPVKTSRPVPKERVFDVLSEMKGRKLHGPARIGMVVIESVCGLNANVVVTKNVD